MTRHIRWGGLGLACFGSALIGLGAMAPAAGLYPMAPSSSTPPASASQTPSATSTRPSVSPAQSARTTSISTPTPSSSTDVFQSVPVKVIGPATLTALIAAGVVSLGAGLFTFLRRPSGGKRNADESTADEDATPQDETADNQPADAQPAVDKVLDEAAVIHPAPGRAMEETAVIPQAPDVQPASNQTSNETTAAQPFVQPAPAVNQPAPSRAADDRPTAGRRGM